MQLIRLSKRVIALGKMVAIFKYLLPLSTFGAFEQEFLWCCAQIWFIAAWSKRVCDRLCKMHELSSVEGGGASIEPLFNVSACDIRNLPNNSFTTWLWPPFHRPAFLISASANAFTSHRWESDNLWEQFNGADICFREAVPVDTWGALYHDLRFPANLIICRSQIVGSASIDATEHRSHPFCHQLISYN